MIAPLVAARNRELLMEMVIDLILGIVVSTLVFGFEYLLAWLIVARLDAFIPDAIEPWIPGAFVGISVVVSFGSAWFSVDPLRGHRPLSFQPMQMEVAQQNKRPTMVGMTMQSSLQPKRSR